jgi:2-keto-3-deoxy-L-rhamnonate aldolase RhmA
VIAGGIRRLRSVDSPAFGVLVTLQSFELIELYGRLGFEWLLLDAEHAALTPGNCRELTRAADLVGIPCVVRIPQIRASTIEGFLDIGVSGILASHVQSSADVRGVIAQANERTAVCALIESQRAIDELDSILAIPELDYVAIGPNDLGRSLGVSGGASNPQVSALVEAAQRSIKKAGKRQLTVVADAAAAQRAAADGATLIAVPDATLIRSAGREFLQRARVAG